MLTCIYRPAHCNTRQIPFTVIGERNIIYPESGIRETLLDNMRHTEEPF